MTRTVNNLAAGIPGYGSNFTLSIGMVKDNADPAQHGRLKIYIPSVDTASYKVDDLAWATYVSPFGGTTANALVGPEGSSVPGGSAYGFWAIPKVGAQVLVGCLESDPNVRFWMGCMYMAELNRTLPQSVNPISTELDESGVYPQATIPHYKENLTEAGLEPGSQHFMTRGGWQRSVSHPSNKNRNKPLDDGYYTKPNEPSKADSQIHSFTTPGRHYWSMSDLDIECRIRLKTTNGTQVILDDTNERIYISTARGRSYVEIDEGSGKIYFYTASKFNVHSENDINLYSDQNINIVAKKRVNIQSEERGVKIQGKLNVEAISSAGNVRLTASRDLDLRTTNGPRGEAVAASQSCSKPPYAGGSLGLNRDYAEEAGSNTSNVSINGSGQLNLRTEVGSVIITAKQDVQARGVDGSMRLTASSGLDLKSINSNVTVAASKEYRLTAAKVRTKPNMPSTADFTGIATAADLASAAATVSGEEVQLKMIVPKHEPWVRDEDEEACPTPRNSSYQG